MIFWIVAAAMYLWGFSVLLDKTRSAKARMIAGTTRLTLTTIAALLPLVLNGRANLYNALVMSYGCLIMAAYLPVVLGDAIDGRTGRPDQSKTD